MRVKRSFSSPSGAPGKAEMTGLIVGALDDLERIQASMKGVVVTLDDMRCRVTARPGHPAPGPRDHERAEN